MPVKQLTVWATSLGCPKNRVDTERLLGSLGLPVKLVRHAGRARLIFINTCAFIEPATRESIRAVLDSIAHLNNLRRKPLLVVAGCLPGRYDVAELQKELPEVDLWLLPQNLQNWPEQLNKALQLEQSHEQGRLMAENSAYAWLKISDGCNHKCAFCTIPAIRGPLRSEPEAKLLQEAGELVEHGARELILVAQDTGSWGKDWDRSGNLLTLLRKLAKLPGLDWLRLLYLYPNIFTPDFLKGLADIGKPLLPYFDIPFQHSETEILGRMGRPFKENPRQVLERIRKVFPEAALRTTLMVGYPGETEAQFENLLQFAREARFQHLGVFTWFAEEGTRAAALPDQVPYEVREERKAELMQAQAAISQQLLAENLGRRMQVLIDAAKHEEWPGLHQGRVWFQAPEIDGVTWVSGPGAQPGAMPECEIIDTQVYDMSALV